MHFLLLLLLCAPLFAQPFPPDSVWTFQYDNGGDEFFYDAIEVEDGYLLCGESREWNTQAGVALLVKIDFTGQLVWERTYPEDGYVRFVRFDEYGTVLANSLSENGLSTGGFYSQIEFADGTLFDRVTVDSTHSASLSWGNTDADHSWGIRQFCFSYTAGSGQETLVWATRYGWSDPEYEEFNPGVSFVCTGSRARVYSDPFFYGYVRDFENGDSEAGFFKVNSETGVHALRIFGGDGNEHFNSHYEATWFPEPSVTLVGATSSFGNDGSDLWIVKLDSVGDSLWSRHYGGLSYEDGVEIVEATDEGFVIAGNFSSEDINFEQSDFWLLKVDDNGDSVWSVLAGGEESDHCEGMIETQGGFLLFGNSMSFTAPGWDACAMLLGYDPDLAVSPNQLNFGPTQVGDSTLRTLSLINTGSNLLTVSEVIGNAVYHPNFPQWAQIEVGDTFDVEVYFAPTANGNYIDTLEVRSDAISGTKYIRVLGAGIGGSAANETPLPLEFRLHSAYPNPFNNSTQFTLDLPHASRVTLSIFDIRGRLQTTLNNSELSAGSHTFAFDASNRAAGLYFLRATSAEFTTTQKLVLLK